MIAEIAGGVLACSVIHIPAYLKLRSLAKTAETERTNLASDKQKFWDSIQTSAAANATSGCRTCSNCKRVVHRWELDKNGSIVCFECRLR